MIIKKKTKTLAIFVLVLSCVIAFTGCGQSKDEDTIPNNVEEKSANQGTKEETKKDKDTKKTISDFPKRPINLIIGFDPGTGADQSGRLIASLAEEKLGQTINIINKPGGAGALSYQEIREMKPNGYNIVMGTVTLVIHDLMGNIPFSYEDLTPIMTFQTDTPVIYASKDAPFKNWEEMVSYVKEHPGEVTMATGAVGGIANIVSLIVERETGLEFNIIPASGGGAKPLIQAAGGHVDIALATPAAGLAQVRAGNVIPLATSTDRIDILKDTPSLKELGVIDGEMGNIRSFYGPPGMDQEIVKILSDAFIEATNNPKFDQNVKNTGAAKIVLGPEETLEKFSEYKELFKPVVKKVD